MKGALLRYRIMAYITGVLLILLVGVAVPLKYLAGEPFLVAVVGSAHGWLYMVYLLAAYDLCRRCKWTWTRTGLVMLAGTVPVMSFVAERKITAEWIPAANAGEASQSSAGR